MLGINYNSYAIIFNLSLEQPNFITILLNYNDSNCYLFFDGIMLFL